MNDLPISSHPDTPGTPHPGASASHNDAVSNAPHQAGPNGGRARRGIYGALGALALLLAAQWWSSHAQLSGLRDEVAQRLRAGDTQNTETQVVVKAVQEGVRELQGKVSVLESRQLEAQSQQLALEQLYQDMSKSRDDWALAEIEQVLSTASQQLQLAGNVQGALIALQNADNRLSLSDRPQFIIIRRALANDMDRLKALPSVDLPGIALRLDSIIGQVDNMPLLSDEKPALPVNLPRTASAVPQDAVKVGGTASDLLVRLHDAWRSWSSEMWDEVRQLIRVRNVESPDALLLSPTQAYYARENLKLRLLNARLALLSRNESAFRSDLGAAQDTIAKYFDTRARQTQTAQALVKQVQASNLSIEMPTLAESLNAVRNYKAKP
jgi:uroporphyrin-3 C-methyltransferase